LLIKGGFPILDRNGGKICVFKENYDKK